MGREWLDTAKMFFTADQHFSDPDILRFQERRGAVDVGEMDAFLAEAWNDTVGDKDVVIVAGDFCVMKIPDQELRCDEFFRRMSRLRGKKVFVPGNHDDHRVIKRAVDVGLIEFTTPQLEFKYHGQAIAINHYPMLAWRGIRSGAWHLHGHVHNIPARGHRGPVAMKDIGVDARPDGDLRPWSFEEIKEEMGIWEGLSGPRRPWTRQELARVLADLFDNDNFAQAAREVLESGAGVSALESSVAAQLKAAERIVELKHQVIKLKKEIEAGSST